LYAHIGLISKFNVKFLLYICKYINISINYVCRRIVRLRGLKIEKLEERFDEIFSTQTCFASLNMALSKILSNRSELLLVLKRPEIPLHNTGSENDIREYVTVRKISAGTRSDLGRECRDTFTSHKKTCRKNDISFWDYLGDRLSGLNLIPRLADLIRRRARAPAC
jgi:hypothetical protein